MKKRYAFRVGIISAVLLCIIAVLLVWKSSLFLKVKGYQLVGEFDNVGGLLPGSEVRFRGYRVGKIFKVSPDVDKIRVYFSVSDETKLPRGSRLRVVFDGLVGERFLSITPPSLVSMTTPLLKAGDRLEGYSSPGLADAVEVAVANMNHTEAILRQFRTIFTSDQAVGNIYNILGALDTLTQHLSAISKKVQSGNDIENMHAILENVKQISLSLKEMTRQATAKQLIGDIGRTVKNVTSISEGIHTLTHPPITPVSKLGLEYATQAQRVYYIGEVDWMLNNSFLRTTLSNRSGDASLMAAQLGTALHPKITGRAGFLYAKPGVGIDITPIKGTVLSADMYQNKDVQLELNARFQVSKDGILQMNVRKDAESDRSLSTISLGILYKF